VALSLRCYAKLGGHAPVGSARGGHGAGVGEGMWRWRLPSFGGRAEGYPPESVGSFLRSQYQVFNVPWELRCRSSAGRRGAAPGGGPSHGAFPPEERQACHRRYTCGGPAWTSSWGCCCTDVAAGPRAQPQKPRGGMSEVLGEARAGAPGGCHQGTRGASPLNRGLGSLAGLVPLPRESALKEAAAARGEGRRGATQAGAAGARRGAGGAPLTLQGLRGAVQGLTGDRQGGGARGGAGTGAGGGSQEGVQSDADAPWHLWSQLGRTALELGAQALARGPLRGVPGGAQPPALPAPPRPACARTRQW